MLEEQTIVHIAKNARMRYVLYITRIRPKQLDRHKQDRSLMLKTMRGCWPAFVNQVECRHSDLTQNGNEVYERPLRTNKSSFAITLTHEFYFPKIYLQVIHHGGFTKHNDLTSINIPCYKAPRCKFVKHEKLCQFASDTDSPFWQLNKKKSKTVINRIPSKSIERTQHVVPTAFNRSRRQLVETHFQIDDDSTVKTVPVSDRSTPPPPPYSKGSAQSKAAEK